MILGRPDKLSSSLLHLAPEGNLNNVTDSTGALVGIEDLEGTVPAAGSMRSERRHGASRVRKPAFASTSGKTVHTREVLVTLSYLSSVVLANNLALACPASKRVFRTQRLTLTEGVTPISTGLDGTQGSKRDCLRVCVWFLMCTVLLHDHTCIMSQLVLSSVSYQQ